MMRMIDWIEVSILIPVMLQLRSDGLRLCLVQQQDCCVCDDDDKREKTAAADVVVAIAVAQERQERGDLRSWQRSLLHEMLTTTCWMMIAGMREMIVKWEILSSCCCCCYSPVSVDVRA